MQMRRKERNYLLLLLVMLWSTLSIYAQTSPRPLYALPDANTRWVASSTIALAPDGRTVATANMLAGTVTLVDLVLRERLAEIEVGDDPRSVAFTPDGRYLLVANRNSGTLDVIDVSARQAVSTWITGGMPQAVVTATNAVAYVVLQANDEIVQIDIQNGQIGARIAVPSGPAGLALWGDFLYVTHFWTGELSLIYLPQMGVVRTVRPATTASLASALAINPRTGMAYLPQSLSHDWRPALTYDSALSPVVHAVDLRDLGMHREGRIALDRVDRPLNMPFAAAVDVLRNWLYVVSAGSDALSVIDLGTGLARAHIPVGMNPRGVVLNRDYTLGIVHNAVENSLTIIDARLLNVIESLPLSDAPISSEIYIGARLFHTAADPRMSMDHGLSCASCHMDGTSDGRLWQGYPGGMASTPDLRDVDIDASTVDYLDWKIRELQAGRGLTDGPESGSLDLELLVAYLRWISLQ